MCTNLLKYRIEAYSWPCMDCVKVAKIVAVWAQNKRNLLTLGFTFSCIDSPGTSRGSIVMNNVMNAPSIRLRIVS